MFHNDGYALCDDATRYHGNVSNISTLSGERQSWPDSQIGAEGLVDGGGGPPISSAGPEATRGVNSAAELAAGIPPTRLTLKPPGPDFIFSTKYLGGN